MSFDNPVTQGTKLVIDAIQSPNFVPGTAGWIIRKDGTAEFLNVTARGELVVTGTAPSQIRIYTDSGVPVIEITGGDGQVYTFKAPSDALILGKDSANAPTLEFTDDLGSSEDGIWLLDPVNSVGVAFRQADGFLYRHDNFVFNEWKVLPTLQNGWTSSNVFYQEGRYRLGPDGFVVLDGILAPGTTADSTLLFTMPAGYRPAKSHLILGGSGGPPNTSTLQVNADGTCRCFGTGAAGMSLSNMRYPVAGLS